MQTLLVAVDSSPLAKTVLDKAVKYAGSFSARLVLLRVVGLPSELPPEALNIEPAALDSVLRGAAWESLSALAESVPRELVSQVRVELGVPWQAICEVAKAERADLIVMGSHGHGVIGRLLGTTSTRVINHTDRDVLVVRPDSERVD